jgi:adenylosuccinate synthase
MFDEIKQLSDNGINIDGKLFVSNRAHIVTNA